MNILLVNPNDLYGRRYVILPNLGLGYIAAALESSGHKVEIWDELKKNENLNRFKTKISKLKYAFDLIGFYFASSYYSSVYQYSQLVKDINDKIIIVVGGPHPTVEPLGTLKDIRNIDFAIIGEGEEAFPELIEAIERGGKFEGIYNLAWRQNGRIIVNERKFLDDLDKISMPAWHLLKPDTYPLAPNTVFIKKKRLAPVVLTRGCPFGCNFCAASTISGREVRRRDLKNVIEEIFLLKLKYNVEEIHIMDDAFTVDKDYVKLFCNMLIEEKMGITWACPSGVRLDTLDKKLIQLMEGSGCYSISVGIESGVQRILDFMKRNTSIEKIKEKIDLVKKFLQYVSLDFLLWDIQEKLLWI